jgi:antitoxin HicB
VELSKATDGTILVDVPSIPEAHTFGENREQALLRAVDAIESALSFYAEHGRPIPPSDPFNDQDTFITVDGAPATSSIQSVPQ